MSTQHPPQSPSGVDQEAAQRAFETPLENPFPPPTEPVGSPPTVLRRSTTDRVVGGVCGGLGPAAGVDPIWFRLGFIFLTLSSGVGILLYIIAWVVIPEATGDEVATARPHSPSSTAVVFGIVLLVIGSALLVDALLPWFDRVVWPLGLIGLGVGLVYFGSQRRQT